MKFCLEGGIFMKRILSVFMTLLLAALSVDLCRNNAYSASYIKGIDVSEYNGTINWGTVAGTDTDFAILRCGTAKGEQTNYVEDSMFVQNYNAATSNDIKVGAYMYTFARTEENMAKNVRDLLNTIDGRHLDYPIYLDFENAPTQASLGKQRVTELAIYGCDLIRQAGYKAGVYANLDWFTNYLDPTQIKNAGHEVWIAHYTSLASKDYSSYNMWQYTESGKISGISGTVDVNVYYTSNQSWNKTDNLNWAGPYYPINGSNNTPVYDYGSSFPKSNKYISPNDDCYLADVYQDSNGIEYVLVDYPTSSGREDRYYARLDAFNIPTQATIWLKCDVKISQQAYSPIDKTSNTPVYEFESNTPKSGKYISPDDDCYLSDVYQDQTNGVKYVLVDYPTSSGRENRYYARLDAFKAVYEVTIISSWEKVGNYKIDANNWAGPYYPVDTSNNTPVYEYGSSSPKSNKYISPNDDCYLADVYQDGSGVKYVLVDYPTSSGREDRYYARLDSFGVQQITTTTKATTTTTKATTTTTKTTTTTTKATTTVTTTSRSTLQITLFGDANVDGRINMGDVVLIMQSIVNPDKYGLNGTDATHITLQGITNGDTDRNGLTNNDALGIQKMLLGIG